MFESCDFSDDDAAAPPRPASAADNSHGHSSPAPTPHGARLRQPQSRERSRTQPAKVASQLQSLLHRPGDVGFTPVTLARSADIGSAAVADAMGDTWAQSECHCLRCEVLRLGAVASEADDVLARARETTPGSPLPSDGRPSADTALHDARAGAPASKATRAEGRLERLGRRRGRSETPAVANAAPVVMPVAQAPSAGSDDGRPRPLLVLDLDNYGFPQMKAGAPASLVRLLASGRILVWALYGAGFRRFFGVDARDYVSRIPVRDPVRSVARMLANAACGLGAAAAVAAAPSGTAATAASPARKKRAAAGKRASREDAEPQAPTASAGPSAWSALKASHALLLSRCGAQSQAADSVILDAAWLAAPDRPVVVATGDRGLQREVAGLPGNPCA
eukprot:CAMPEP_0174832060 /NCGR_PEP_ID=MMETSP1114-20130205/3465_1 /TAXON_ID=312471 /ORGANISM="Neobodo designis, Strain CCAP 1951/1" /LENGTH=392 /DNA_ID=CAMNT_0016065911 /DNA_START=33 /DNA_END=1208 /DNA_ORIENTATION=+